MTERHAGEPAGDQPTCGGRTFRHLLVPLDGSRLAEEILLPAAELARRHGARLTLLHVLEHNPPETIHGEPHLDEAGEAAAYLAKQAERLAPTGVEIDCHVHENPQRDVAASLVVHAVELGCDLIVLTTHGRGGLRDVLVGNIAQQVVARGDVPVLLARPDCAAAGLEISRVFVPLDGTPDAEQCLPQAEAIARASGARLVLLRVVPTARDLTGDQAAVAALLPSATRATLEIEEAETVEYLRAKRQELAASGVEVEIRMRRGDPAAVVPEEVERVGANLVAMATHGRAGLGALWSGSLGYRVIERLCAPVLIVRSSR